MAGMVAHRTSVAGANTIRLRHTRLGLQVIRLGKFRKEKRNMHGSSVKVGRLWLGRVRLLAAGGSSSVNRTVPCQMYGYRARHKVRLSKAHVQSAGMAPCLAQG